jgi:hypothetical protein
MVAMRLLDNLVDIELFPQAGVKLANADPDFVAQLFEGLDALPPPPRIPSSFFNVNLRRLLARLSAAAQDQAAESRTWNLLPVASA